MATPQYNPATRTVTDPNDPKYKMTTDDADRINSDVLVMISRAFAVASLVLVSVWAASNDSHYLGLPVWKTNALSWHAVLMVAGFYFCLIFASTIYLDKSVDRKTHWLATRWVQARMWFWKIGIVAFGIAAMVAIVQWKNRVDQSHEASFHAWIGTLSFGTVFYYVIIEAIRQSMKARNVNENTNPYTMYLYRTHQEFIGLMAMVSTVLAIITGTSDYLSAAGGCNYRTANQDNVYQQLPSACRLAQGMEFCVFFAAIFAMLAGALQTVNYYHQNRIIRFGRYMEIVQPNKNETALVVSHAAHPASSAPTMTAGAGYGQVVEKHHGGVLTSLQGGTVEDGKEATEHSTAV
jgi:hypothetical protein